MKKQRVTKQEQTFAINSFFLGEESWIQKSFGSEKQRAALLGKDVKKYL